MMHMCRSTLSWSDCCLKTNGCRFQVAFLLRKQPTDWNDLDVLYVFVNSLNVEEKLTCSRGSAGPPCWGDGENVSRNSNETANHQFDRCGTQIALHSCFHLFWYQIENIFTSVVIYRILFWYFRQKSTVSLSVSTEADIFKVKRRVLTCRSRMVLYVPKVKGHSSHILRILSIHPQAGSTIWRRARAWIITGTFQTTSENTILFTRLWVSTPWWMHRERKWV